MFVAAYTAEPDVLFDFPENGTSYRFGRDDAQCDIVIWSALNDKRLSRVAGRLWRMDDQLWLANHSESHDLWIVRDGGPPEPFLQPRELGAGPTPARSLPQGTSLIVAPAGCEILVTQLWVHERFAPGRQDDSTLRLPPIPEHLQDIANTLCRPILDGSILPATYSEIMNAMPGLTIKRARRLVAELTDLYIVELPDLAESVRRRASRQHDLLTANGTKRLVGGVWRFSQEADASAAPSRSLVLPDCFEVAHLLVRRGLVKKSRRR